MKGITRTFTFRGITFPAMLVDAKQPVTMQRTVADMVGARRVDPEYCMNANMVMRLSESGIFPHPVVATKVTKAIAYVLRTTAKKYKGKVTLPIVVRYLHDNWEDIKAYDRNEPVTAEKKITFRAIPPSLRLGAGRTSHINRNPRPSGERRAKPRVCNGQGPRGREMDLEEYEKEKKGIKLYTGKPKG